MVEEVCTLKLKYARLLKENDALKTVISNVNALPNLNEMVLDLQDAVNTLTNSRFSLPESPLLQNCPPSTHCTSSETSSPYDSSECDDNQVTIYPGLVVMKAQKKLRDMRSDAKSYIYSLMAMLWSRDVLSTHSLTSKRSNAHKDKVPKPCLDPDMVKQLSDLVSKKFNVDERQIKIHIKAKLNNIVLLCAVVAAASASYIGAYGHGRGGYGYGATVVQKAYVAPVKEPATPYEMGYDIVDEYGNKHGRRESGDTAGNKAGSYNIALADGRQRVVEYKADDYGFRAVVRSNEPGTDASQDPADVVQEPLGPAPAPYAARKVVAPAPSYRAVVGHRQGHGHGYGHGYNGYSRSYNHRAEYGPRDNGYGRYSHY
ncbi:Cuticle protein 14 isoform a [Nymphon striatum]|nr:Cuticle protein 14 isoform a [Nymphon striatum]